MDPTCNAGDLGSISELGRSPGGGHGNSLQYSCLENPMDRGAWWATVLGAVRVEHDWVTKHRKPSFYHLFIQLNFPENELFALDMNDIHSFTYPHLSSPPTICNVGLNDSDWNKISLFLKMILGNWKQLGQYLFSCLGNSDFKKDPSGKDRVKNSQSFHT